MNKHSVRNTGQALAYITDCNLATVCDMAGKKSKSKSEYARQILIAQTAIDWGVAMGVDFSQTRAAQAIELGGVKAWAAKFEPPVSAAVRAPLAASERAN